MHLVSVVNCFGNGQKWVSSGFEFIHGLIRSLPFIFIPGLCVFCFECKKWQSGKIFGASSDIGIKLEIN